MISEHQDIYLFITLLMVGHLEFFSPTFNRQILINNSKMMMIMTMMIYLVSNAPAMLGT
jgi:hypothetical protein